MPLFSFQGGETNGRALLESAMAQPWQTFDGQFLYPRFRDKAAALMRSLIKNHAFLDGNKRVGLTATQVFLLINDYSLQGTQEERVEFALRIAASEPDISVGEVSDWLETHSVRITYLVEFLEETQQSDTATNIRKLFAELANDFRQLLS